MNIIVDAANIPQMIAGTKYNIQISLVLQVVYTAWDCNLLNWYKDIMYMQLHLLAKSVKSLNLEKHPSEEPSSANYRMP